MLVLEPVTQSITVNARGYMSGQIPLRGWSARDVRHYSVEPLIALSETTLPVAVRLSPATAAERATVLLDGEPVDITRPLELEPDSYAIEMRFAGYRTLRETIEVSREQFVFDFTMQELQEEAITIRTEPAGATVFIDGQELGVTDTAGILGLFRLPGRYEITVFRSGYRSQQQAITVEDGGTNEFLVVLEMSTAQIILNVEPVTARVLVNQQPMEHSGMIELPAGTHRFQISNEGYDSYSENILLEQGETVERTIRLEPHIGSLQYRVSPSFAQTELLNAQGQLIESWTGIRRLGELPVGSYRVRVVAEGYEPAEETVLIERDQVAQAAIQLQPTAGGVVVDRQAEPITEPTPIDSPGFEVLATLPSRNTALTASLLLPGGGHIYSGQSRGYLYLLGGLAAGGYAVYTLMEEGNIESDYIEALRNFNSAGSFSDVARYSNETIQHYNDWNDLIDRRTIALAAFAGIYAIQLVDMLIRTPERGYRDTQGGGWQASSTGAGVRLRYSFN